jgi:hypothetical protein
MVRHNSAEECAIMAILAELELKPDAAERRGSARRRLRLISEGTTPSSSHARVFIRDLSVSGLLIESSAPLSVGEVLVVNLPEAGAAEAIVKWDSGHYFGCQFTRPISKAVVSAAQLLSPAAPIEGDAEVISIALAELRALGTRIQHITEAVDRAIARLGLDRDK